MHLARFPRARFAHLPTPLEAAPRLGAEIGVPRLFIKRDDCTGLAGGGNKTRKLEFLLGDALAKGADTLVTQGAVQSNHVRQTAAAAARHGMACEIILEERTGSKAVDYNGSGNVLLDRLLGASIRNVPGGTDMNAELAKTAEEVRARGGKPYVIPGGGSTVRLPRQISSAILIIYDVRPFLSNRASISHAVMNIMNNLGMSALPLRFLMP